MRSIQNQLVIGDMINKDLRNINCSWSIKAENIFGKKGHHTDNWNDRELVANQIKIIK